MEYLFYGFQRCLKGYLLDLLFEIWFGQEKGSKRIFDFFWDIHSMSVHFARIWSVWNAQQSLMEEESARNVQRIRRNWIQSKALLHFLFETLKIPSWSWSSLSSEETISNPSSWLARPGVNFLKIFNYGRSSIVPDGKQRKTKFQDSIRPDPSLPGKRDTSSKQIGNEADTRFELWKVILLQLSPWNSWEIHSLQDLRILQSKSGP